MANAREMLDVVGDWLGWQDKTLSFGLDKTLNISYTSFNRDDKELKSLGYI